MSLIYPFTNGVSTELQAMVDELGIDVLELAEMENELNFDEVNCQNIRDDLITPVLPLSFIGQRETDVDQAWRQQESKTAPQRTAGADSGVLPQAPLAATHVTSITVGSRQQTASAAAEVTTTAKAAEYASQSGRTEEEDQQYKLADDNVTEATQQSSKSSTRGAPHSIVAETETSGTCEQTSAKKGEVPQHELTSHQTDMTASWHKEKEDMQQQIAALQRRLAEAELNRLAKRSQDVANVAPSSVATNLTTHPPLTPLACPQSIIQVTNMSEPGQPIRTLVANQISPGTLEVLPTQQMTQAFRDVSLKSTDTQHQALNSGQSPSKGQGGVIFTPMTPTQVQLSSGAKVIAAGVIRGPKEGNKSGARRRLEAQLNNDGVDETTTAVPASYEPSEDEHNEGSLHDFLEQMRAHAKEGKSKYMDMKLAPINKAHPVWNEEWPSPKPEELTPGEAALLVELDCKDTTAPHVRRRRGIHTHQQMLEEYSRYEVAPLQPYKWKSIPEYLDWVRDFYVKHGKLEVMLKKMWKLNPPIEAGEKRRSSITFHETCQNTLHALDESSVALALHEMNTLHQRCRTSKDSSFTPPESCVGEPADCDSSAADAEQLSDGEASRSGQSPNRKQARRQTKELKAHKHQLMTEYIACELCEYSTSSSYQTKLKAATDDKTKTEEMWIAQRQAADNARKYWSTVIGANLYRVKRHIKEWQKDVQGYDITKREWYEDRPQSVLDGLQMAKEILNERAVRKQAGSDKGSERSAELAGSDQKSLKRNQGRAKAPKKGPTPTGKSDRESRKSILASTSSAVPIKQEQPEMGSDGRLGISHDRPPPDPETDPMIAKVVDTVISRHQSAAASPNRSTTKLSETEPTIDTAAQDSLSRTESDSAMQDTFGLSGDISDIEMDADAERQLLASSKDSESGSRVDTHSPRESVRTKTPSKKRSRRTRTPKSKSIISTSSSDCESPAPKSARRQSPVHGGALPPDVARKMKRIGLLPETDMAASPAHSVEEQQAQRPSSCTGGPAVRQPSGHKHRKEDRKVKKDTSVKTTSTAKKFPSKETRWTTEYKEQQQANRRAKRDERKEEQQREEEKRKACRLQLNTLARMQAEKAKQLSERKRRLADKDDHDSFDAAMYRATSETCLSKPSLHKRRCATSSPERRSKQINISPAKIDVQRAPETSQDGARSSKQRLRSDSQDAYEDSECSASSSRRKQRTPKKTTKQVEQKLQQTPVKTEPLDDNTVYQVTIPADIQQEQPDKPSKHRSKSNSSNKEKKSTQASSKRVHEQNTDSQTINPAVLQGMDPSLAGHASRRSSKTGSRTSSPSMSTRLVSPQLIQNALATCHVPERRTKPVSVVVQQLSPDVLKSAMRQSVSLKDPLQGETKPKTDAQDEPTRDETLHKQPAPKVKRTAALKSAEITKGILAIGPMADEAFDALTATVASEAQPKHRSKLPENTTYSTPSTIDDRAIDDVDSYKPQDIPPSKQQHKVNYDPNKVIKVESRRTITNLPSEPICISSEEQSSPGGASTAQTEEDASTSDSDKRKSAESGQSPSRNSKDDGQRTPGTLDEEKPNPVSGPTSPTAKRRQTENEILTTESSELQPTTGTVEKEKRDSNGNHLPDKMVPTSTVEPTGEVPPRSSPQDDEKGQGDNSPKRPTTTAPPSAHKPSTPEREAKSKDFTDTEAPAATLTEASSRKAEQQDESDRHREDVSTSQVGGEDVSTSQVGGEDDGTEQVDRVENTSEHESGILDESLEDGEVTPEHHSLLEESDDLSAVTNRSPMRGHRSRSTVSGGSDTLRESRRRDSLRTVKNSLSPVERLKDMERNVGTAPIVFPQYREGGVFDTNIPEQISHMSRSTQAKLLNAADSGLKLLDTVREHIAQNPPPGKPAKRQPHKNIVMTPLAVQQLAQEVKQAVINHQIDALEKFQWDTQLDH